MHRLAIAAAALGFFLNPGFGCTSGPEDDYQYGEAEMKAAVEGTWVVTLEGSAGAPNEEITLQVLGPVHAQPYKTQTVQEGRRGIIRSAAACGTRTFLSSAHACVDSSRMPLTVAMVSGPESYRDAALSGDLSVFSLVFTRGSFGVTLGDLQVWGDITPDGTVLAPFGRHSNGSTVSVLSLVRTAK